ncbi:MAG TPA: RHS repeat-associated core domain-containing protein [Candidatus Binatia bacterium]|nr:RHS repeat-associated core domain-containing protein [Candidatus Binatia bacterium]
MSSENQLQAQRWRIASDPTNYLYDGLHIVEQLDGGGNILAKYAQGRGIDEPLAELLSTTPSYYEQDALGSVTSLSSASGVLANTYVYGSFGQLTASSGTVTNALHYTGRELDLETGVYNYRARYFDPSNGRFLSEDPIRFGGGTNSYRYVTNNPVVFSDPLGLCPPAKKNGPPHHLEAQHDCLTATGVRDISYTLEDADGHPLTDYYVTEHLVDRRTGQPYTGGTTGSPTDTQPNRPMPPGFDSGFADGIGGFGSRDILQTFTVSTSPPGQPGTDIPVFVIDDQGKAYGTNGIYKGADGVVYINGTVSDRLCSTH